MTRQDVLRAYRLGYDTMEIAAMRQVPEHVVYKALAQKPRSPRFWSSEDRIKLLELVAERKSRSQIAKALQRSKNAVGIYACRLGILA